MKYEVIVDFYGYVQVIRHTGTIRDFVELDLEKYDLSDDRIYAYKLGKNELIFDEKRYQQILDEKQQKADQKEISELKAFLYETDYICARAFEEVMSLTNPITYIADVIKIQIKYTKEYAEVLKQRVAARARIKELGG